MKAGIPETVAAGVVAICATAAAVTNHLSSDGLTAVYGAILGYVFGRVHNNLTGEKAVIQVPPETETITVHKEK